MSSALPPRRVLWPALKRALAEHAPTFVSVKLLRLRRKYRVAAFDTEGKRVNLSEHAWASDAVVSVAMDLVGWLSGGQLPTGVRVRPDPNAAQRLAAEWGLTPGNVAAFYTTRLWQQHMAMAETVLHALAREKGAAEVASGFCSIIRGRYVAPTPAELARHEAVCGRWLVRVRRPDGREFLDICDDMDAVDHEDGTPVHWIALLDGRPCAWPVAAPSVGGEG